MTDKPASPFSGIKLSGQATTPDRGTDQQLFASPPPSRQTVHSREQENRTPPSNQATNLPTKEARKEDSLEPRKQGTVGQLPSQPAPLFNINEPANKNNTYTFTEEELWAVADLGTELERKHGLEVTKYNLVRLGSITLLRITSRTKSKASSSAG